MYKSYSIRSELDHFLKSKETNHGTLIKTLFGRSKNVNTKTDMLTWLSDHPEDMELFEIWMRNNGGKSILDKMKRIASESANCKENKDQKLYHTLPYKVAADVVSLDVFNDFKTAVEKEFKSFKTLLVGQENRIQELERKIAEKDREIEEHKTTIENLKEEIKSGKDDNAKLVIKLREKESENTILRDNVQELLEDISQLQEELRAQKEHKVISETDTTLEERNNTLEEEIKAKETKLSKFSARVKQMNDMLNADRASSTCTDYMLSSDDADTNSTQSQSV